MPRLMPEITHLQYRILEELDGGREYGRRLRAVLAGHGVSKSGPAFYQLMDRLEDAGLVTGEYVSVQVGSRVHRERAYKLSPSGATTAKRFRAYYEELFSGRS